MEQPSNLEIPKASVFTIIKEEEKKHADSEDHGSHEEEEEEQHCREEQGRDREEEVERDQVASVLELRRAIKRAKRPAKQLPKFLDMIRESREIH